METCRMEICMIIDTHVHIGNMLGFVMTEEMILESMRKYNIDYCIISNGDSGEFGHDLQPLPMEIQISQTESFKRSIRFARENTDKIGIMPWIKPATETADEELEELIRQNLDIVKGIKVHPYHSKTFFDSKRMEPYMKLAEKYNLPVMTHTGGCEEAHPKYVYNMAKKHPDVNFIMAHMGLGTDNKEAVDLMDKADNLYADTAWVPVQTTIEVIRRYGSKRVLFGSDSPIDGVDTYYCNKEGQPSMYREYFNGLEEKIGKEAYSDLMYRNAISFFNLDINI